MKNYLPFDTFLKSLKTSNRTLDFFTDWQKCLKNKNEISIAVNYPTAKAIGLFLASSLHN